MSEQLPKTMKAAVVTELNAAPVIIEMPVPTPSAGEALVRVDAAALQPVELAVAAGRFFDGAPTFPYVPGLEAVGTVVESSRFASGARVRVEIVHPGYGRDGCFAEYVTVPEKATHSAGNETESTIEPVPPDLDPVLVAAIGSSGQTGKLLLERAEGAHGALRGAHVLVLGATGVVGEILVQLCKQAGASRVVAAGRSRRRLEVMRGLGADAAVELPADAVEADIPRLTEEFRSAADGRLDVVLDPLWGVPAAAALDAVGDGGVLVNFGQSSAPRAPMSGVPLRALRVTVIGQAGARSSVHERRRATAQILADASAGRVSLTCETVPLDEFPDAWERQRRSPGAKLVIIPAPSQ